MKLTILPEYKQEGMTITCTLTCYVKYGSACKSLSLSKLTRLFPIFTVKGIANCQDFDKFDQSVGERIALNRAKIQAYNIYRQQMINLFQVMLSICNEVEDAFDKYEEYLDNASKQREFLYNLVNNEAQE